MSTDARPFLKWAGGKGQLLSQLSGHLPERVTNEPFTYIEPFVGGGAMLFYMLQRFANIRKAVINDVNEDLILTYRTIKDDVEALVSILDRMEKDYLAVADPNGRSQIFYEVRERYNQHVGDGIERASQLIFLNKTCFNGLYRVNRRGQFNVPFGKYANPKICDEDNLRNDNALLQKVEILNGDYAETLQFLNERSFYYLDPPYKPISETSSFNSYSSMSFDDEQQIRLKGFCDTINEHNGKFMLSNSDPKSVDEANTFFDDLYGAYNIHRVLAKRNINAKGDKRGEINELLITNY
jgi:DNA adenine methylase